MTSNTASFSITTAPNQQAAGTYTVQFFNGSNSFGADDRHDHVHQRRRERVPGEPGHRARHPVGGTATVKRILVCLLLAAALAAPSLALASGGAPVRLRTTMTGRKAVPRGARSGRAA